MSLDFSSLYEFSPLAIFFILFFTTFVTEDGACLAAGALAGQGRISFALALTACFAGIFIGDIGLYWIGRVFGDSISKTRFFRKIVSERRLKKATVWLEERGPMAIVISRFVSGLRLPTYLAAGFLRTNFTQFAFYFFVATAIWTPVLVGSATFVQKIISPQYLLLSVLALFVLFKLISSFTTWKKRRLFAGRLKKIGNWEFWPLKLFYFPVVLYVFLLAFKHKGLTVFTCANPAILASGFIGESKHEIYEGLKESNAAKPHVLEHEFVSGDLVQEEKAARVYGFLGRENIEFPLVVKPDVGERGMGVKIVKSRESLDSIIEDIDYDFILQEFAEGQEVSAFYYRYPSERNGTIFSLTEKNFPQVTGDGESTLETLILRDERAVCLARKYFGQNQDRLETIPLIGTEVQLIDIGTHSLGAIFKEGNWLETNALVDKIDEICKGYEGFYFGRFDIKARSFNDLKKGSHFKIIELNGVTSESTNIYDKRYSLFDAYRILFDQWRIAFEIGEENRSRGVKPTKIGDLIRLLLGQDVSQNKSN